MTTANFDRMTDDNLVQFFKKRAAEQGQSLADVEKNNKIDTEFLAPCAEALSGRGIESLQKLVGLIGDDDPSVRRNAATFAFEAAPNACRQALLKLTTRQDVHALLAWMVLGRYDPASAPALSELYK